LTLLNPAKRFGEPNELGVVFSNQRCDWTIHQCKQLIHVFPVTPFGVTRPLKNVRVKPDVVVEVFKVHDVVLTDANWYFSFLQLLHEF